MVQVPLFSNMKLFLCNKGIWGLPLAFFLLTTQSYASSYLPNDFRDEIGDTNFQMFLDGKTEQLPLNLFEDEWSILPKHKGNNSAFGTIHASLNHTYDNFTLGIYQEKDINVKFNDGFVKTWFICSQDINQCLFNEPTPNEFDIDFDIGGAGNFYNSQGVYFQKIFKPLSNHFISLKTNLMHGKELQHLETSGTHINQRYFIKIDYFYNYKNIITKNNENLTTNNGLGYGFDLEYIYEKNNIYLYGGIFNLGGIIYWKDITRMYGDIDNKREILYTDDDGHNHISEDETTVKLKYDYHTNFTQNLPLYYKATINYQITDIISFGNNLNGYEKTIFNEPYTSVKIGNTLYKLGYILGNNDATFGVMFEKINLFGAKIKNLNLEVSNKFGSRNDTMMAKIGFSF
jgi:hypothetical protein